MGSREQGGTERTCPNSQGGIHTPLGTRGVSGGCSKLPSEGSRGNLAHLCRVVGSVQAWWMGPVSPPPPWAGPDLAALLNSCAGRGVRCLEHPQDGADCARILRPAGQAAASITARWDHSRAEAAASAQTSSPGRTPSSRISQAGPGWPQAPGGVGALQPLGSQASWGHAPVTCL